MFIIIIIIIAITIIIVIIHEWHKQSYQLMFLDSFAPVVWGIVALMIIIIERGWKVFSISFLYKQYFWSVKNNFSPFLFREIGSRVLVYDWEDFGYKFEVSKIVAI